MAAKFSEGDRVHVPKGTKYIPDGMTGKITDMYFRTYEYHYKVNGHYYPEHVLRFAYQSRPEEAQDHLRWARFWMTVAGIALTVALISMVIC